jgi:hypothetical protein
VPTLAHESAEVKAIDAALQHWRQGDLALEEGWFIHIGDPAEPLTDASAEAADEGLQAVTSEVAGLAVVTQTCDVVRTCVTRPYVEVSPLVRVGADDLSAIQRGRRPALATLPALLASGLAVDLDRVMTVEKSVVASWTRTPGYIADVDARTFAQALARKRLRFAFPDDFTELAKKLHGRLADKHEKNTDEGRGLRALREIRVQATPSWDATTAALFFWFIRGDADADFGGQNWADLLKRWLELVQRSGRFTEVDGQVVTLGYLTAADYVGSDPLDLDHLSSRPSSE